VALVVDAVPPNAAEARDSTLLKASADMLPGLDTSAGEIASVRLAVRSPPPVRGAVVEMVRELATPPAFDHVPSSRSDFVESG